MPNHGANTPQLRPEKRGDRKESGKTMAWRDRARRKAFPQSTLRHFSIAGFSPPITRGHALNPSLRRRRQRYFGGTGEKRGRIPAPGSVMGQRTHGLIDTQCDRRPLRTAGVTQIGNVFGDGLEAKESGQNRNRSRFRVRMKSGASAPSTKRPRIIEDHVCLSNRR
jgi:hypothetical protein